MISAPIISFSSCLDSRYCLARWLNLPWPVIAIASLPPLGALFLYRRTPLAQTWAVLGLALLAGAFRFTFSQAAPEQVQMLPLSADFKLEMPGNEV